MVSEINKQVVTDLEFMDMLYGCDGEVSVYVWLYSIYSHINEHITAHLQVVLIECMVLLKSRCRFRLKITV